MSGALTSSSPLRSVAASGSIHGRDAIYPNIYAVLVGDAGNGKSLALSEVRDLLVDIENVPIAHSIETPEGLLSRLAGDPDRDPRKFSRARSPPSPPTTPSAR